MTESMTSAEYLAFRGQPERPKSVKRIMAGRDATAQGKRFEDELDRAHAAYAHTGLAIIDRLPVPTNPMPASWLKEPKMKGRARLLAKKQGFDFYGSFGPAAMGGRLQGRAIAMEAKSTKNFSVSLPIHADGPLRPHQLEALAERWTRFGVYSAVVWINGALRGVLTPDQVAQSWQDYRIGGRGTKTIAWSKFTPYEVRTIDEHGPIDDWLAEIVARVGLTL